MPWRPQSFSDLDKRLARSPEAVSNDMDMTLQTISKLTQANSDAVAAVQPTGSTTKNRPTNPTLYSIFFDTTLGKPIWFVGKGKWVDATGAVV